MFLSEFQAPCFARCCLKDNPTTNVYFNEDNTRLYFTQDGVEYCLVMVDPNSTGYYDYDRAAIVTAAQAKWLGKYTLEGGKLLQVMLSAGYSPAISASYGTAEAADTVSDLVFQADNLISFRVGQFYHGALMAGDGSVSVTENILDTTAPEYAYLGNYAEQGIVFGFALSVGEDGQLVARYTVTRDGEELTYAIDTALRVIVVTEEDGSKTYYTRCMEVEDPLLAELDEEIFALLGTYTAGGHTVTLLPYFTASTDWYGDSPDPVCTTGNTCQYRNPASFTNPANLSASSPSVPIPYSPGRDVICINIPAARFPVIIFFFFNAISFSL